MNDDRQVRLTEVGALGQARIERSTAHVRGTQGASVEEAYLRRAGVREILLEAEAPTQTFPHAKWFRFSAPLEIGGGAWRALQHLRRALGLATEGQEITRGEGA